MAPVVDPSTLCLVTGTGITIAALIFDAVALGATWVKGMELRGGQLQATIEFKLLRLCPPQGLDCLWWRDVPDRDLCCGMEGTYGMVAATMFLAFFVPLFGLVLAGYVVVKQQHWRNSTIITGVAGLASVLLKLFSLGYLGVSTAYDPDQWVAERWTYSGAASNPGGSMDREPTTGMFVAVVSMLISLVGCLIFLCYTKVNICNDVYVPGDNLRQAADPRLGGDDAEDGDDGYDDPEGV